VSFNRIAALWIEHEIGQTAKDVLAEENEFMAISPAPAAI
jgi:hypothetical protein